MGDDGISVNNPIERRPAEHEIFLTFTDDLDAEIFYDWLYIQGFDSFKKYKEDNQHNY